MNLQIGEEMSIPYTMMFYESFKFHKQLVNHKDDRDGGKWHVGGGYSKIQSVRHLQHNPWSNDW